MITDIIPPRILSLEFHTQFLPRLLWDRLRRKKKEEEGTSFTSTLELTLALAACLIIAAIGIPSALNRGSILGLILSIIGIGGILVLFVLSIGAQWGKRPTYNHFLTGVFFFFVSLGIFIGIPVGMVNHSLWLGLPASVAGLLGGYIVGIFSGLRLQHIGWIAEIGNMLAGLAAIMIGVSGLVMLLLLAIG